jgi:hypothetical protein
LRAEIKKDGKLATCSYCSKQRRTISLSELADHIECAFGQHYYLTSTEPGFLELMAIKEGDADFERRGEPVVFAISEAAMIEENIATDVQKLLEDRHYNHGMIEIGEECEFDEESYYAQKNPNDVEFRESWHNFEHSLKTQTRFFNRWAETTLNEVFEGLDDHETVDGRRVVVQAGPGKELSSLFRARIFQSSDSLEKAIQRPDIEIGPPPHEAATAGRMNARGISVFYGATTSDVALAEIRPPVGSRVVVGQFQLLRPVRLLDVVALQSVLVKGSIFDGGYMRRLEQAKFLEGLSRRISMPVMPNDETSNYLITQAIADYLATEVKLDGIIYPSAQVGDGSQNVVLFHDASGVKRMELPEGTEIDASLRDPGEGGYTDYRVWEKVPPPPQPDEEEDDEGFPFGFHFLPTPERDNDSREPTLELVLDSLRVRHIDSVAFTTSDYDVPRHRLELSKPALKPKKKRVKLDDVL